MVPYGGSNRAFARGAMGALGESPRATAGGSWWGWPARQGHADVTRGKASVAGAQPSRAWALLVTDGKRQITRSYCLNFGIRRMTCITCGDEGLTPS